MACRVTLDRQENGANGANRCPVRADRNAKSKNGIAR